MNESDRAFAFALARVQFPPRCSCLRFVDSMVWFAQHGTRKPITTAQRKYLYSCVIRFQRQINSGLVESARKELAALKAAEQAGGAR